MLLDERNLRAAGWLTSEEFKAKFGPNLKREAPIIWVSEIQGNMISLDSFPILGYRCAPDENQNGHTLYYGDAAEMYLAGMAEKALRHGK